MSIEVIRTPVLVVGGGPVGLALACDLGWRGQSCVLVEERTGATQHPKATLVGARSMEHFRRWGIDGKVFDAGLPQDKAYYIVFTTRLCGAELYRFRSPSIAEVRSASPEVRARWRELAWSPYSKTQIGQQALEPLLLALAASHAPRVSMRHGWRLTGFRDEGSLVRAEIEHVAGGRRAQVEADYLVACDGGASGVRRELGIRLNGRGIMRANVSFFFRSQSFLERHGRGIANLYFVFAPDSCGVFTAIDGRELWNYQYYFLDPAKRTRDLDAAAILHRAMGEPFDFELLATTHWHHHQSVARQWRSGRVFLAGDAAHLFPPTGGVGMNTGIGDAVDLAWKLDAVLRGWGGPALLASYERERKPIAVRNSILSANNSDKIDMVMDETPPDIERAGERGTRLRAELAQKIRWLAKQFNSAGVHLGYRYADSPICVPDGTFEPPDDPTQVTASTWPGCRAPHLWLEPGRSMLDLFGRTWVLLDFGRNPDAGAPLVRCFEDARAPVELVRLDHDDARSIYERRFVLVRPDGHVAWRGDDVPGDVASVVDKVRGA
ncbi:MAG TPA: FAD-dependent monooxygenase [Steroidobacteraceae bacterium]|nr:FAD-dependent monooxygenase [Steroidobacteraceae bacterium]